MSGLLFGSITRFCFETRNLPTPIKKKNMDEFYQRHFEPKNIDIAYIFIPNIVMDTYDKGRDQGMNVEQSKLLARKVFYKADARQKENRELFLMTDDSMGAHKSRLLAMEAEKKNALDIYVELIKAAKGVTRVMIPSHKTEEQLLKAIFPILPPPVDLSPDET